MTEKIRNNILQIWKNENLNMLDIHAVQVTALERKMYDLIVYINDNLTEYIQFIDELCKS